MSDTVTVTVDEIEALATKIDVGDGLDDHDRVVVRALLVLAAERLADLARSEVEGFSFDFGPPGLGGAVGLTFPTTEFDEKSSPKLFQHCCTGKHIAKANLTL